MNNAARKMLGKMILSRIPFLKPLVTTFSKASKVVDVIILTKTSPLRLSILEMSA